MNIVEQSSGPLAYSIVRVDGKVRNLWTGLWETFISPTQDQVRPFVRPAGGVLQSFQVADIVAADGFDLVDDARCYGCFRFGAIECHAIQDSAQCVASTLKFTWMAWIKPAAPPVSNATFIGEGAADTQAPLFQFRQDVANPRVLGFCYRDSAGTVAEASGTIAVDDGGWHHAAVTGDGKECVLYVDGKRDASASIASIVPLVAGRVCFGGLVRSTLTHMWSGSLDDVRSYAYAAPEQTVESAATRWLAGPTGNGDLTVVVWDVDSNGKPTGINKLVPLGWLVAGNPRPGGSV